MRMASFEDTVEKDWEQPIKCKYHAQHFYTCETQHLRDEALESSLIWLEFGFAASNFIVFRSLFRLSLRIWGSSLGTK